MLGENCSRLLIRSRLRQRRLDKDCTFGGRYSNHDPIIISDQVGIWFSVYWISFQVCKLKRNKKVIFKRESHVL